MNSRPRLSSKITDNGDPWIKNPASIGEFWKIACRVNKIVAK